MADCKILAASENPVDCEIFVASENQADCKMRPEMAQSPKARGNQKSGFRLEFY